MEKYQRGVVALIRASGARLAILHDHRLVDLWRRYSQQVYHCGWIPGDRQEVYRFVAWSNNLCGITREILQAQRAGAGAPVTIRSRLHLVRGWDQRMIASRRLQ